MRSVYSIEDARLDDLDRAREECDGDEGLDEQEPAPRLCGWCCGRRSVGNHEECRRQIVAENRRRTGL